MLVDDCSMETGLSLARQLFDTIGKRTFDGIGYTRAAYGEGEQVAHDIVAAAARELDLEVDVDAALNLSMTLKGVDNGLQPLVIGSHLDAVPQGGNFDGLAGVLAGLACIAAFRTAGLRPPRDIMLLANRAEESAWFGAQHIGSRALLGTLRPNILEEARRIDTGLTLAEHMRMAGVDMSRLRTGLPLRNLRALRGYVELHIEQGPVLVERDLPVGVVSGIRGNRRCREAVCAGTYAHSGTEPRSLRHDAVFAVSELVTRMDDLWRVIEEEEAGDLVVTFGRFATNPLANSVTTVPGEVKFSFDARSHTQGTLARVEAELQRVMEEIARRRGVSFSYDSFTGDVPVGMDRELLHLLLQGCERLSIPTMQIASGAGHDAGDFAAAGVPSAMIFVRNDNGSHNPREAMEFDDFAAGVRLLTWFVENLQG